MNYITANDMDERDKLILRAFALKIRDHLKDDTFESLPFVFQNHTLPSWKETRSRVAFLSGLHPVAYDCCPNSCCCFVGPHALLDKCPYCNAARYSVEQRARKSFVYVPLAPRLVALYRNVDLATKMEYRSQCVPSTQGISDIFDGSVYRNLTKKHVVVDGRVLPYTYFSDPRDIALGLATDGFAPFRRRKATTWPLIVYNYNLPPEIRFRKEYILCIGVVPGPKKPKDMDSFLYPLVEELLQMAVGIRAFDVLQSSLFALHAYLIVVSGDIPALTMLLNIKGHNAFSPCRACKITGVQAPSQKVKTYYVPLSRHQPLSAQRLDAANLPLRTHSEMLQQAREVQLAPTQKESDHLAKKYGIKAVPILSYAPSLVFPASFPYDFMHLIWENLIPNLISLWTGSFKGLDQGCESYYLPKAVWEAIGELTAACGATMPSAFCSRPPNIAHDLSSCTADSWSFWALYLGPVLLRKRFSKPKYYDHFIELVKLLHICLQFELSNDDIRTLRAGFARWVEKYEECVVMDFAKHAMPYLILRRCSLYYQHNPSRLSTCTLTIHALLHIADYVEATGPVWTSWSFPLERFCGRLQPAIRSRRFPYASIAQYVVDDARLTQIQLIYNISEDLRLHRPRHNNVPGQLTHNSFESGLLGTRITNQPSFAR
jgi:hypothetical protein